MNGATPIRKDNALLGAVINSAQITEHKQSWPSHVEEKC